MSRPLSKKMRRPNGLDGRLASGAECAIVRHLVRFGTCDSIGLDDDLQVLPVRRDRQEYRPSAGIP
jgi:hypothetical protein